ncbi:MAG: hypothetical protein M0R40_09790 [Firmicutes bacterium]|nr:hypothetical protein [Bacillota bacterium]
MKAIINNFIKTFAKERGIAINIKIDFPAELVTINGERYPAESVVLREMFLGYLSGEGIENPHAAELDGKDIIVYFEKDGEKIKRKL